MHFNVVVSEREGLGISWDEEQPPLYEDVPASPPTYGQTEELPEYRPSDVFMLDHNLDYQLDHQPNAEPSSSSLAT